MPHLCRISESQSNIIVFIHIHTLHFYFINGFIDGKKMWTVPFNNQWNFLWAGVLNQEFLKLFIDIHTSFICMCAVLFRSWGQHFNKSETFHKEVVSCIFHLRSFGSLSCHVTQLLWVLDQTEALTFCCTISGYDLDFVGPSVTVSHTGPEAARQIFISNYHFSFFPVTL